MIALIRSCAGICKINYALPTKSIYTSINKYDNSLRKSLEEICQYSLDEDS